jgi:hypothetical protein
MEDDERLAGVDAQAASVSTPTTVTPPHCRTLLNMDLP